MKIMKLLFVILTCILLISGAQASFIWASSSGCWTASDGTYHYIMWNSTGMNTWTPSGSTTIDYFIVAAGAGGGDLYGGAGGAGGVLNNTGLTISGKQTIFIGTGSTQSASTLVNGGDSSFGIWGGTNGVNNFTAKGGGAGAHYNLFNATSGGSGGGGAYSGYALVTPGSGTSGQGYNGGAGITDPAPSFGGGGGGGAGAAGADATPSSGGNGGIGVYWPSGVNGSYYGGGGGGASAAGYTPGTGGLGGGGNGVTNTSTPGSGTPGTGGGGGAGNAGWSTGGSGTVIIRYISGFNQQDLWLPGSYTLKIIFTDSSTGAIIPVVNILDSNGKTYTTTNGTFIGTYAYSVVAITASATGYNAKQTSYVVDSNLNEVMQLTPASSTSSSQLNLLYPVQVQFQLVDGNGLYLTNTSTTATMIASPNDYSNWFNTLFGISNSATPLNTTVMIATSDSHGIVAFPMISSATYRLTFTNLALGVSESRTETPAQTYYMYILHDSATAQAINEAQYITSSLSTYPPASTYPATVYLIANYSDAMNVTTSLTFYVNKSDLTPVYSVTYINTKQANSSYAVINTKGSAYTWGFNATNTQFGFIEKDNGITLPGTSTSGLASNMINVSCTNWGCT